MLFLPRYWISAKHSQFVKDNFFKFCNCKHSRAWAWPLVGRSHVCCCPRNFTQNQNNNYSTPTRSSKLTERKSFTFMFRLLTLSISMTLKISQFIPEKWNSSKYLGIFTPHCLGHLVLVRSLPTIHISHQSLEQMHWFEVIFKMFCSAVFEAVEVKGQSRLNFEAATSKFVIGYESLAANLEKVRQTSVWQAVPKFWFIWLCYLFAIHLQK